MTQIHIMHTTYGSILHRFIETLRNRMADLRFAGIRQVSPFGLLLLLLVGCSSDDEEAVRQAREMTVGVNSYVTELWDYNPSGTRAGTPVWAPSGYLPYDELQDAGVEANERAAIGVYFTQNDAVPEEHKIKYFPSDSKWRIDIDDSFPAGSYFLYGYVPYDAATASITGYGGTTATFSSGARLTLMGINTVMNKDICVIVGAKDGTKVGEADPLPTVNPMKAGDFSLTIKELNKNDVPAKENHLFFLFDHLYAALRFRFRVDEQYAALRHIKLKSLSLKAYDRTTGNLMKKKMNATITLQATPDGSSPITSVTITPDAGSDAITEKDGNIYYNEEGMDLPSGKYTTDTSDPEYDAALAGQDIYSDYIGFVPKFNCYYDLICTYDVYDSVGRLIRLNQQATNRLHPLSLFEIEQLERGMMYTLRITVNPTYLYVLSDPDLDNPTMTID